MSKPKTKKEAILRFVDSKGLNGATYTEIIKFIFERNHPGQTYDWRYDRGYYSDAFARNGMLVRKTRKGTWIGKIPGSDRLIKALNRDFKIIYVTLGFFESFPKLRA